MTPSTCRARLRATRLPKGPDEQRKYNRRPKEWCNTVMDSGWMLKKVVLLIDKNSETRRSRANAMRTKGVTVHCAANPRSARPKMDANVYDLILVDFDTDDESADAWVRQVRENNPRQLLAFLVGSPMFVATTRPA